MTAYQSISMAPFSIIYLKASLKQLTFMGSTTRKCNYGYGLEQTNEESVKEMKKSHIIED